MIHIHDHLTRALETLELLDLSGQIDFLAMAAMETGGYYKTPDANTENTWDARVFEIKAHGVFAQGDSERETIRNWIRTAHNCARALEKTMRAEATLRSTTPVPDAQMRAACETVLNEQRSDWQTMRIAQETLRILDEVAA